MEELSTKLKLLKDYVGGAGNDRDNIDIKVKKISADVCSSITEDLSEADVPAVVSLLVGNRRQNDEDFTVAQTNLLEVAKNVAKEKEMGDFLRDICEIFSCLIEKNYERFSHKVLELKSFCTTVFFTNPSSKAKVEALVLLEICFEKWPGKDWSQKLDIENLAHLFMKQLSMTSKNTPTALSRLCQILGKMCESFPADMKIHSSSLINSFVSDIKMKISSVSAKLDLSLLEGSIKGLTCIITAYGIDQVDFEMTESIYEILRKVCRKPEQEAGTVVRRGAMRAGLQLLADHSQLFSEFLVKDHTYWFPLLRIWSQSKNRDDTKIGWKALNAFLATVGKSMTQHGNKSKENTPPRALQYFITEFKAILLAKSSTAKDVSLAIQGYGQMAQCFGIYLSRQDLDFLCQEVLGRTEQLYIECSSHQREEWLVHLPSHLEACSLLLRLLPQNSSATVNSIERLAVLLIEQFPNLPQQFHFQAVAALRTTLSPEVKPPMKQEVKEEHHIKEEVDEPMDVDGDDEMGKGKKDDTWDGLLQHVVYQGVLRSCSHPAVGPTEKVEHGVTTYQSYLPLWRGLISQSQHKNKTEDLLGGEIYKAFLESVFRVIDKLDLSTKVIEETEEIKPEVKEESMSMDLMSQTQNLNGSNNTESSTDEFKESKTSTDKKATVSQVKDHTVLVNLIDICNHVLPLNLKEIENWMKKLWHSVIVWSCQNPQVSSFYKLANQLLLNSGKIHYFKNSSPCLDDVSKYLKEVHKKCLNFHDELLLSCLTLIVSIPNEFLNSILPDLPVVMEQVFHLGLSVLPLADKGLDAMHRWLQHCGQELMGPVLDKVIPKLRFFLSTDFDTAEEVEAETEKRKIQRGPIRIDKRKLLDSKVDVTKTGNLVSAKSMRLLARVSTKYKLKVFPSDVEVGEAATSWDMTKHLKITIPLSDMHITVELDSLLPIAVELCREAADRKTRVVAAELLHVIVLFIIGRTSQQTEDMEKKQPMTEIFKRLFPVLLELAADSDSVIKNLYNPLFSQLIHWFTKNRKFESPETVSLLDCIIETVCSDKDTLLKDQAALFLKEFLEWSIKQSGTSNRTHNTKSIMKRLYYLWRHPDSSKRLGACMAFNKLYQVFREDRGIVNEFLLEALVAAMTCVKLSHFDNEHSGTTPEAVDTVNHLKKILLHYKELFNKESADRRVPRELEGGTVEHVLAWLVKLACSIQTQARHLAMEMFFQLSPRQSFNFKENIVSRNFGSLDNFVSFVESSGLSMDSSNVPDIVTISLPTNLGTIEMWNLGIQAAMECYTWLIGMKLLKPEELLNDQSKLLEALKVFVTSISQHKITELVSEDLSPLEALQITKIRCTTIIRFCDFAACLLESRNEKGKAAFLSLRQRDIAMLLFKVALEPDSLGFDLKSAEEKGNFEACYLNLFKNIKSVVPNYHEKLQTYYSQAYLSSQETSLESITNNLSKGNLSKKEIELLTGYIVFSKNKLFKFDVNGEVVIEKLCSTYSELYKNKVKKESSPSQKDVEDLVMELVALKASEDEKLTTIIISMIRSEKRGIRAFTVRHKAAFSNIMIENARKVLDFLDTNENPKLFLRVSGLILKVTRDRNEGATMQKVVKSVAEMTGQGWGKLTGYCANDDGRLLELIHHLRSISTGIEEMDQKATSNIMEWWCNYMEKPRLRLKIKQRILGILHTMTTIAAKDTSSEKRMKIALQNFGNQHFPVTSAELEGDMIVKNEYLSVFRNILATLEVTASPTLYYFVLSVACREKEHVAEEEIQATLFKMMQKTPMKTQLDVLAVAWDIFSDTSGTFSNQIKLSAVSRFLVPALTTAGQRVIINFFLQNMETLLKTLHETIRGVDETRERLLMEKTAAFYLFGMLYSRLDQTHLHSKGAELTSHAADSLDRCRLFPQAKGDGKELSTFLIKKIQESRIEGEPVDSSSSMKLSYRKFHSSNLNAMIAIISCIQNVEKFYNHFIFKENPAKNELIWSRMIDLEKEYTFNLELDQLSKNKKQLVTVRQSAKVDDGVSPEYIQSHYLADSSFSQDISQYDYSYSSSQGSGSKLGQASGVSSEEIVSQFIELEGDELGSHACMGQLVAVIRHMNGKQMYPVPDKDFSEADPPSWMKSFVSVLKDDTTHKNVHLFLLKLMLSCSEIFEPFAKTFLVPVLDIIGSRSVGKEEDGINYMISDLLIMLLSWSVSTGVIPDGNGSEKLSAGRVLNLVMAGVYHDRRDIFRHNLELVRSILEVWKPCVREHVDYRYVENLVQQTNKTGSAGVQLLAALLVNGVIEPTRMSDLTFVGNVISKFDSRFQAIFQAAAETSGMMLKLLKTNPSFFDQVKNKIDSKLKSLSQTKSMDDQNKFLNILYFIHKHHPEIVKDWMQRFQYTLKNKSGIVLSQCLEMIVANCDSLIEEEENLKTELNMMGIKHLLSAHDPPNQKIALVLLDKVAAHLSDDVLKEYISLAAELIHHNDKEMRKGVFTIFEKCIKRDEPDSEIMKISMTCLLTGLSDQDQTIQESIRSFFNSHEYLPNDSCERLRGILTKMYVPDHESVLIRYLPFSLLSLSCSTPGYNKKIYTEPLDNCVFQDQVVDTSWRQQHAGSMLPMFADTLASQTQATSLASQSQGLGVLKATQSTLQFAPTQAGTQRNAMDVSVPVNPSLSTSLLFSQGGNSQSRSRTPSGGVGYQSQEFAYSQRSQANVGNLRAGKRFFKEQKNVEHQTKVFSKIAARDKARKSKQEEDRKGNRESAVTLLRKYRIGDLPDIQISFADLISPIMKLSQINSDFAKTCFVLIFGGIYDQTQELMQDAEFLENISKLLSHIFQNCDAESSSFMSAIIQVCLNLPEGNTIDVSNLSNICRKCEIEPLGILLLEKYITSLESNELAKPTKRMKTSEGDDGKLSLWIQLSDLYRSIGEYESVRGIFSTGITCHPQTLVALNHESNSEWGEVQKVYKELVTNYELIDNRIEQEVDLWKRGYYESFQKLGQWDKLAKQISEDLDGDLNNVWEKQRSSTLLEPLMESHTHQILDEPSQKSDIYGFLNQCFLDKNKRIQLKKECSLQVAALLATKGQHAKALSYITKAVDMFRISTFNQNVLLGKNSTSSLLQLQAFVEIQDFLWQKSSGKINLNGTSEMWSKSFPLEEDDLKTWDDVLSLRRAYLRHSDDAMEMEDMYSKTNGAADIISTTLASNYIKLCDSALSQRNYAVSLRMLKIMQPLLGSNPSLRRDHDSLYTKAVVLRAHKVPNTTNTDVFCMLFRQFNKYEASFEDVEEYPASFFETKRVVYSNLFDVSNGDDLDAKQIRLQLKYEKDKGAFDDLLSRGNIPLQKCIQEQIIDADKKLISCLKEDPISLSKAYHQAATFCHGLWEKEPSNDSYARDSIVSHLQAMKHGNQEARTLFPRTLKMAISSQSAGKVLASATKEVPVWMFLPWLSQLVGSLHNDDLVATVEPIVTALAVEYPTAVVYPYRTSFHNTDLSDHALAIKDKMDKLLNISAVEESLVSNLGYVTVPHVAALDLLKSLPNLKAWYKNSFRTKINEEYEKFKQKYLVSKPGQGMLVQKFARDFGRKLESAFKTLSVSELSSEIEAQKVKLSPKLPKLLKDYSTMLAEFQGSNHHQTMEIPGQYSGKVKPDPARHVTISSFQPAVLPFASLRLPIRVGMVGNDGRTYQFIVKFGEDLRQDQRIEQLFSVCNSRMALDPNCRSKPGMEITTYNVVPLNGDLGIIEFVPKTMPLKNFINTVPNAEMAILKTANFYGKGLQGLTHTKSNFEACVSSWKVDDKKIASNYNASVNQLDKFLLKSALQNLSSCCEGFFILRRNFIRSYAVISAMQWILGIGDRHTSNYLICQRTGRMITIDFGYSFGVATSFLPVPELVSLRLTPQLLGVMAPHGTSGLFRETLLQVLASLRASPHVILAALDLFVHEPTVDWVETAKKEAKMQKIDIDINTEKFPQERVAMAVSKLSGGNPTSITVTELKAGQGASRSGWGPQGLRKMVSVVEGERLGQPGRRGEALWPDDEGLSAAQQADCLIHQATDPALLGRMWSGWQPTT